MVALAKLDATQFSNQEVGHIVAADEAVHKTNSDNGAHDEKNLKITGVQELHDQFKGLLKGIEKHAVNTNAIRSPRANFNSARGSPNHRRLASLEGGSGIRSDDVS